MTTTTPAIASGAPFHIILYEPEIPPNTGNIIRLCANTGAQLHLIEPLGFLLDDRLLRRAGLDYHEYASLQTHANLAACLAQITPHQLWAFTTRGTYHPHQAHFCAGDALLFGPESRGLPLTLLESLPQTQRLRLPMRPQSRSLNLSNSVAVALYEAWRQLNFC